ncbi:unnamed protein product, partial [marine sediment metagenome]
MAQKAQQAMPMLSPLCPIFSDEVSHAALLGMSLGSSQLFMTYVYTDNRLDNTDETRQKLVSEYKERFANPYIAAARGYIDDVIDPRVTRPKLIRALETLENPSDSTRPQKNTG